MNLTLKLVKIKWWVGLSKSQKVTAMHNIFQEVNYVIIE